jgi:hypothetical protein
LIGVVPDAARTGRRHPLVEHDPEKACPGLDPGWAPAFGKDHAPTTNWSGMTVPRRIIPL